MESEFERDLQSHLKQYIEDQTTVDAFSWDIISQFSVDVNTHIVDMNKMSKIDRSRFYHRLRYRHYEVHQYVSTGIDLAVCVAFDWFTNTIYMYVWGKDVKP